jgi:hypothetical protein
MSKWTVTITRDMVDEFVLRTKDSSANFYQLVEEQIALTLNEVVIYAGFLLIVRDGSPQCHFALGGGRQIRIWERLSDYGKTHEDVNIAMCTFKDEGNSEALDKVLPWSLTFTYDRKPRNIVFHSKKGYVKEYHFGRVLKTIWPTCPQCDKSLGMYNKDSAPGYSLWKCNEHGDIEGVGITCERESARGTVCDSIEEAHHYNMYEATLISHYSPKLKRIEL